MRAFSLIYGDVLKKKNLSDLSPFLPALFSKQQLKRIPDDRYLSAMAKCIFRAGFVWKVVEAKWDGFEEAFHHFDPARIADLSIEDMEALTQDARIIRNFQKINAVADNAVMIRKVAETHRSFANYIAEWNESNLIDLWLELKNNGARLGGMTGPMFLRDMGKDTFILTKDVIQALIKEDIIDKPPTSKKALSMVQEAFNTWNSESGLPYSHISKILALSV